MDFYFFVLPSVANLIVRYMKKVAGLLVIVAMLLCGCGKDKENDSNTMAIVKEMAVVVNFSTLDEQVLDVVDITILGTDFEGNEINVPVTKAGEYRWKKIDPIFVDGEYLNPITLEIKIEAKVEPKEASQYVGGYVYEIDCEAYESGATTPFCTKRMSIESVTANEVAKELSNLIEYQKVLQRGSLKQSTYTFDFGWEDVMPNFGWNTTH